PPLRTDRHPAAQRPAVRRPPRLRPGQADGDAQAALRLPVPDQGRRPGAGAPQADALRAPEAQRDRARAARRAHARLAARQRRDLRRHRRAGRRQRPDGRHHALAGRPARRGTAGHGRDPGPRLPRAAAAAPARRRAARGGADLRGARARGRAADHGDDRRAAGAARPRGGLRDPGAVARRRGGAARGSLAAALRDPRRVLLVAGALAVLGWGLDTQAGVETDVQKLVPQKLTALRDLRALQESTGVGGEIDVVVSAPDLTDAKIIAWMTDYQQRLLRRYGYGSRNGCGAATLCPAFSLTDLLRTQGPAPSQQQVRALLDAVPAYFSQTVLTRDRTT